MTDVHDKITRSYNMSQIRSKDTKPELLVRKLLHSKGFRFRLHNKDLPGKPDIYLKKYNSVIFINGCFWHGHTNCKYFVLPKTRSEWWKTKIERNIANDLKHTKEIKKQKLNVITIWECELKKDKCEVTMQKVIKKLRRKGISFL